jgi:hypothetical protein
MSTPNAPNAPGSAPNAPIAQARLAGPRALAPVKLAHVKLVPVTLLAAGALATGALAGCGTPQAGSPSGGTTPTASFSTSAAPSASAASGASSAPASPAAPTGSATPVQTVSGGPVTAGAPACAGWPAHAPTVGLPVSFVPVAVERCVNGVQTIPGKGLWQTASLQRADSGLAGLVTALHQPPGRHKPGTACPELAIILPQIVLIDATGHELIPRLPVSGCDLIQSQVRAALATLPWRVVSVRLIAPIPGPSGSGTAH